MTYQDWFLGLAEADVGLDVDADLLPLELAGYGVDIRGFVEALPDCEGILICPEAAIGGFRQGTAEESAPLSPRSWAEFIWMLAPVINDCDMTLVALKRERNGFEFRLVRLKFISMSLNEFYDRGG